MIGKKATYWLILLCIYGINTHTQNLSQPLDSLVPNHLIESWKKAGASPDYSKEVCLELIQLASNVVFIQEKHFRINAAVINEVIQKLPELNDSIQTVLVFPSGTIEILLDGTDSFQGIILSKKNITLRGDSTLLLFKSSGNLTTSNSRSLISIESGKRDGIECLKLDTQQYITTQKDEDSTAKVLLSSYVINFNGAENCWAKNVVINYGLGAHIGLNQSKNITIHGCTFSDAWTHGGSAGGQQGYGVTFYKSNYCLIENNIILKCRHAINLQYYSENNVIAYNYLAESYALNPLPIIGVLTTWRTHNMVIHGFNPKNNLVEGNYTLDTDNGNDLSIGVTGGIHVDNVKDEGNGSNFLYRNFCSASLRVSTKSTMEGYNKRQALLSNTAKIKISVDADSTLEVGNMTNNLLLTGKNTIQKPYEKNTIGQSCYLTSTPDWLKSFPIGLNQGGMDNIPAKARRNFPDFFSVPRCTNCQTLPTSIQESISKKISIYPNPVHGNLLNIDRNSTDVPTLKLAVFDSNMSFYTQYYLTENDNTIDVSEWKQGIYFLHFRLNSVSIWKKIVKL